MTTLTAPTDRQATAPAHPAWGVAAAVLVAGIVLFGLAFPVEIMRAVGVWRESTAYNHCFLILPVSGFLIWERRQALLTRMPEPAYWALVAMVPAGLIWLFADSIGIMEGRQLAAMALFQLFVLAVIGTRAWRVIAFALLYLFFLIPVGAFLTSALQGFSAHFAVWGLNLLGIPNYADGMEIDIPEGRFAVAEACAGLRFLIASVALGTLYGYMMYRSWTRRAAFMIVSIIVPIIANGFRVLGLIVLGHYLGSAQAIEADHIIYGWVFFSFVSLILILLGLPFRQPIAAFPVIADDRVRGQRPQPGILKAGVLAAAIVMILISPPVADGPIAAAIGSAASGLKTVLGR